MSGGMSREHSSTFPGEGGKFGRSNDVMASVPSSQHQTQQQGSTNCSDSSVHIYTAQARLPPWRRDSGQIPIRLLCCILNIRAPTCNEVAVNIIGRVLKGQDFQTPALQANKGNHQCLNLPLSQLIAQEILGVLGMGNDGNLNKLSPPHVRV